MTYADLINVMSDLVKASTYLEIDIGPGTHFDEVNVSSKYAVGEDSEFRPFFLMSVEDFHRTYDGLYFDLMFIDGLLLPYSACKLNLFRALDWMKPDSAIVVRGLWPARSTKEVPAAQAFAEILADDTYSGFSIKDSGGLGVLMRRRSVHALPPLTFKYTHLREHPELINLKTNFAAGWKELMGR